MEHKLRNTERKEQYIVAIARIEGSNETVEARIRVVPEQTLFIKTTPYNDFPQIYDENGVEFVVVSIRDYVLDNASEKVSKFAKEASNKLALVKLEKGIWIDNQGFIRSNVAKAGEQIGIKNNFIYTNEGVYMEVAKRGATGGIRKGASYAASRINGIKASSWTLLSNASGKILNIIDAASFVSELGKGTKSLSILPGISPATAVIGAIGFVTDLHLDQLFREIDDIRKSELEKCKKQGLAFVRDYVKKYRYYNGQKKEPISNYLDDGEFAYYLVDVSLDTANRLIAGEFRTLDELYPFTREYSPKVGILIQKVGHPEFRNTIYIVEAFYIL